MQQSVAVLVRGCAAHAVAGNQFSVAHGFGNAQAPMPQSLTDRNRGVPVQDLPTSLELIRRSSSYGCGRRLA